MTKTNASPVTSTTGEAYVVAERRFRKPGRTGEPLQVDVSCGRTRALTTKHLPPGSGGGKFSGTHSPWPRLAARCPPTLESLLPTRGLHVVFEGCSCHLTARI